MFQVIFNKISAAEMSNLPKPLQLEMLSEFHLLPAQAENLEGKYGVIEREGKRLYRFRTKDYRVYFEKDAEGIRIHRILHKNTLNDFLFRTQLPMVEDNAEAQSQTFWKLIEEAEKSPK